METRFNFLLHWFQAGIKSFRIIQVYPSHDFLFIFLLDGNPPTDKFLILRGNKENTRILYVVLHEECLWTYVVIFMLGGTSSIS
jgi:hypothetical protein